MSVFRPRRSLAAVQNALPRCKAAGSEPPLRKRKCRPGLIQGVLPQGVARRFGGRALVGTGRAFETRCTRERVTPQGFTFRRSLSMLRGNKGFTLIELMIVV